MGAKDSKPSFISYEDALKRVSDSEQRRIREAFKRCAGTNGTALSLEAFVREVLCDGVPYEVAEWLYQACGGTKKGIAFRDLLCGIVVLTKGNIEEKIKFLWTLYMNTQSDNGTYMYRRDFTNALRFENASLPVTGTEGTAEILTSLFGCGDKVTFEQFRSWLLMHKDATVLSKWLLSERPNMVQDLETPTFYQSLAGVTHLEERDIIELEKCFWSLRNSAPTGQLDAESMTPLLSPPLPRGAVAGVFLAFDENRDGHVDFKELCCGLSAACRGPQAERLKFCFKIFDLDRDGALNNKELTDMINILCTVANESIKNNSRSSTPGSDSNDSDGTETSFDPDSVIANLRDKLVPPASGDRKPMFHLGPEGNDMMGHERSEDTSNISCDDLVLTLQDFLIWSVESAESLVTPFMELTFEVCHVVLGLRPQCRHHERDIVLGWLRRAVCSGFKVGQFWYLVGAEWWSRWSAHTAAPAACCRLRHDDNIMCDDSFTASTESMGSLLWRADTASVGSGGSSSGVSMGAATHRHHTDPGPIDNTRLLAPNLLKVRTLTGEGGHLRRDVTLSQHRDFELLPDALWRALALWYGGPHPLPRQVIRPPNSDVELELYPLHLKLLRHVATPQRSMSTVSGSLYGSAVPATPPQPDRQLAYTAAFSRLATVRQVSDFLCQALNLAREDMRLWSLGTNAVLLDDDTPTLQDLKFDERTRLLIEVRNADLTWPEEIGALSMSVSGGGARATERRQTLIAPNLPGATGLHNLGNTCFMNAALQAVWNTGPLTRYFNSGTYMYELNTNNPLGTRGALALRFGELCKEVWSCVSRSVAPLRVRWAVGRWARALSGGGQHDAQEFLAWLLDALHEDLNRADTRAQHANRPHRDSDGRPDQEVAAEAWEAYSQRNQSILTDLFYGQLKSKVQCDVCGRDSVRFDAFNMLSLPLPMESFVRCEVKVILLDGSVPVKYGLKMNSEGTYIDLKNKLSELCELPPESMLLVEMNGSMIGRILDDSNKIALSSAIGLVAYELPIHEHNDTDTDTDELSDTHECGSMDGQWQSGCGPEVSVRAGAPNATNSLCMPALFCFKRSAPELGTSSSPPHAAYSARGPGGVGQGAGGAGTPGRAPYRCNTLPKDLSELKRSEANSSPTLSVKSLTVKPSSPRLGRVKFNSSPSNMNRMNSNTSTLDRLPQGRVQYLIAVHRKQCRADVYFLSSQRCKPQVFGVPLVVPVRDGMSGRDMYAAVWTQVARLLSATPRHDNTNHATDCDDSLGYQYPFTLRVVSGSGSAAASWCARCEWPALCRGCALPPDDTVLVYNCHGSTRACKSRGSDSASTIDSGLPDCQTHRYGGGGGGLPDCHTHRYTRPQRSATLGEESPGVVRRLDFSVLRRAHRRVLLAVDWDPTALHLRYQSTREKGVVEHRSVGLVSGSMSVAVDLAHCLRAFTSRERLDARYHCAGCRAKQPATKKLQIWRAPPILIIHLKRFQYVNNKWIKSQKVVNFPFTDFDPVEYLAAVPQETVRRYREINNPRRSSVFVDEQIREADTESEGESDTEDCSKEYRIRGRTRSRPAGSGGNNINGGGRQRLESSSLSATPVRDDELIDWHHHRLQPDTNPLDLNYRLYAVVSHSGQLSGGHYVAYARNPSGAWLCYNDSMCREIAPPNAHTPPHIDPASAYLLFYERQGLNYEAYLPDVSGRDPVLADGDGLQPDDSELKKMCNVM